MTLRVANFKEEGLGKGPSIYYVVSVGEEGGQKLPILCSKKTTKKRKGGKKKIADFETT